MIVPYPSTFCCDGYKFRGTTACEQRVVPPGESGINALGMFDSLTITSQTRAAIHSDGNPVLIDRGANLQFSSPLASQVHKDWPDCEAPHIRDCNGSFRDYGR